jgi:aspartyl-tRNA(Asn)/glutamyl-tRNA(Gln) amidotransferase subunit C
VPDEPLTQSTVRKVARLAKLALTDAEVEEDRVRLEAVLGHAERLVRLDLADVEPMAHAGDFPAPLRADEPGPALPVETVLRLAPQSDPPFILVPKTLGEGGGA